MAATRWNPSRPCAEGLEWFPSNEANTFLDASKKTATTVFAPTANETADQISLFLLQTGRSPDGSTFELEIYPASVFPQAAAETTDVFRPGEDVEILTAQGYDQFLFPTGTTTTIYPYIANATQVPGLYVPTGQAVDDDSFIQALTQLNGGTGGSSFQYSTRFAALSGALSGTYVTGVQLLAQVQVYTAAFSAPGSLTGQPFLRINGTRYLDRATTFSGTPNGGNTLVGQWLSNPATGCSWAPGELDSFAVGGTDTAGWIISPTGTENRIAAILQGWLSVTYAATDPRLAVACIDGDSISNGWNTVDLLDPATKLPASWSYVAGTEYVMVLRRRTGTGRTEWRYLDSGSAVPGPWQFANSEVFNTSLRIRDYTEEGTGNYAVLLLDSGTVSAQSQPYASIDNDGLADPYDTVPVHTGRDLVQEITTDAAGGGDYGFLRCSVKVANASVEDPLYIVIETTGGVDLSSVAVIYPDDLADSSTAARTDYQTLEVVFDTPATLAAATQYQVRWGSTAPVDAGWDVQVASALRIGFFGGPPAGTGVATYNDTTDEAIIDAVGQPTMDVEVTIHRQPDAMTGVAATEVAVTDCWSAVRLTWDEVDFTDPSNCGLSFVHYELQRLDQGATDWFPIAKITDQAVTTFTDYESRKNETATYRIRALRSDLAPTVWSDEVTAIATQECCGLIFASNEAPELAVYFPDVDPPRTYTFLENVKYTQYHGRSYQIGSHELENRGYRFARTLAIAVDASAVVAEGVPSALIGNIDEFDALLDAVRPNRGATVSYVAVMNESGDRWFASIETPTGTRREPGGYYSADVIVTQTTDVPSQPDAAS